MPFTNIPSTLPKSITVHITRANQLENADLLMSYFNTLYAVEQILDQNLHTGDDDISKFAIELLDHIESFKNDESNSNYLEVLNDKAISVAYIVNFTNKIFNNALKQIQTHTSNKNTGLNLLTAVNFYDLLKLWQSDKDLFESIEENEEIVKKIKYAKFHAARILKTIKKGEDPNDYDPPELELKSHEEEEEENGGKEKEQEDFTKPSEDLSSDNINLSQLGDSIPESNIPKDSIETDELGLPSAPSKIEASDSKEEFLLPSAPSTFKDELEPELEPEPEPEPEPEHESEIKIQRKTPISKHNEVKKELNVNEYLESSEIYSKAQKHAKFAISAMNYEDKETALKELQNAINLMNKLKS